MNFSTDELLNFSNFSTPSSFYRDIESFTRAEIILAEVYLIVVGVVSIFLNAVVIWAVEDTQKKKRTFHPNLFILAHVAVTDIVTAVACLPFVLTSTAAGKWLLGEPACAVMAAVNTILITASVLSILAVSVERYMSIVKPQQYKEVVTKQSCVIGVVAVWVVSGAVAVLQVPVLSNWEFYPGKAICFMDWYARGGKLIFNCFHLVFFVVLPLVLLLVIDTLIVRAAQNHHTNPLRLTVSYSVGSNSETTADHQSDNRAGSLAVPSRMPSKHESLPPVVTAKRSFSKKRNSVLQQALDPNATKRAKKISLYRLKAARILLVVVTCFIVCYLPLFAINLLAAVQHWKEIPPRLDRVTSLLLYTHCFLNACFYGFTNRNIQRTLSDKVSYWQRKNQVGVAITTSPSASLTPPNSRPASPGNSSGSSAVSTISLNDLFNRIEVMRKQKILVCSENKDEVDGEPSTSKQETSQISSQKQEPLLNLQLPIRAVYGDDERS